MHVLLTIVRGGEIGRRLLLRGGQLATVGSSGWADFCLSGDASLADRHFQLDCQPQGCRCRALDPARPVYRNDQPAGDCWLQAGDLLRAGETVFRVELAGVGGSPGPRVAEPDEPVAAAAEPPPPAAPRTAGEICEKIELSETAHPHLQGQPLPEPFFEGLIAAGLLEDAVKFLAMWLPREQAIRWACEGVEELGIEMTPAQSDALAAAWKWLDAPLEENRMRAAERARQAGYVGAPSWLAAAAGWCGGDLAGPGGGPTPPPAELAGQAVIAAVMLAATEQGDEQAAGRYESFLERGKRLLADGSPE